MYAGPTMTESPDGLVRGIVHELSNELLYCQDHILYINGVGGFKRWPVW